MAGDAGGAGSDMAAFARRVGLAALAAVVLVVLWILAPLLILGFGGILFALVLRHLGALLAARSPLSVRWSVILIAGLAIAFFAASAWFFGGRLADQFEQLRQTLSGAVDQAVAFLRTHGVEVDGLEGDWLTTGMMTRLTGAATVLFNLLAAVIFIGFFTVYMAIWPERYIQGTLLLFPKRMRGRAEEVLEALDKALWRWTLGQFVAMVIVGLLTTALLLLLGVPLAPLLGLIAGLLEFIPYLGPWLAAVPILMVAATQDLVIALWAMVGFTVIEQLEANVIAPLAERWAVALPPALAVLSVFAFGILFGTAGVLFAMPATLAIMVVVRMVYVEDVLGYELPKSRMPG